MSRTLDELLAGHAAPSAVTPADVRAAAGEQPRILVVLDDDPTGTQSVADLPVLTDWSVESLRWGLSQGRPAVYVMTNSRSLAPDVAAQRNREVAEAAFAASDELGVPIAFVSRSDSTLRGHFPLEPQVLAEAVEAHDGTPIDGIVVIPAFGDAGRITVDGVHYAGGPATGYTPVGETEFARDATFGYTSSRLADWIAEKSEGAMPADSVLAIGLDELRTDREGVIARLVEARNITPIVCDIVDESDLLALSLALQAAEHAGRRFLYRVAPPFPRARIGQGAHAPLTPDDVAAIRVGGKGEDAVGGLIVIGSHVSMTTRQLEALQQRRALPEIEIDVAEVLGSGRDEHLAAVVQQAVDALGAGHAVVRTTRALVKGTDAQDSLAIARTVSAAVIEVVQRILAARPLRFVIAKGGITSSDVATFGLGIEKAFVRGPMLPGIVSLWEPMDGPARGIPYIVFAGNVGGPESLADVVDTLS